MPSYIPLGYSAIAFARVYCRCAELILVGSDNYFGIKRERYGQLRAALGAVTFKLSLCMPGSEGTLSTNKAGAMVSSAKFQLHRHPYDPSF